MRSSGKEYVGGTASLAPWLGLEVATAVVPDEALEKLNYTDILDYRRTARTPIGLVCNNQQMGF